jgi:hypothetical protein
MLQALLVLPGLKHLKARCVALKWYAAGPDLANKEVANEIGQLNIPGHFHRVIKNEGKPPPPRMVMVLKPMHT